MAAEQLVLKLDQANHQLVAFQNKVEQLVLKLDQANNQLVAFQNKVENNKQMNNKYIHKGLQIFSQLVGSLCWKR